MVNRCLKSAQRWLMPYQCIVCKANAEKRDLCNACHHDLIQCWPACLRCALPLSNTDLICGTCQRHLPYFDRSIAAYHYEGIIAWMIQGLKFRGNLLHVRLMGELMIEVIDKHIDTLPQLLIPVPLHYSRIRQRGFNQAVELARPISKKFNIPMRYCVERVIVTETQSGLSRDQRQKNTKNAFCLKSPLNATHVAIVDDVMTTGSTVNELARLLKKNGAEIVDVWVSARAVIKD